MKSKANLFRPDEVVDGTDNLSHLLQVNVPVPVHIVHAGKQNEL